MTCPAKAVSGAAQPATLSRTASAALGASCRIRSTPGAVRALLRDMRTKLTDANHMARQSSEWETVLAEVLNNIVEHAYADGSDKVIEIDYWFDTPRFKARITDYGNAMPTGQYPQPLIPQPDALPDGGFGLFLVHELAERLDYARENGTNILELEMSLTPS